ncbi:hypothetical protein [Rhodococcoides corynebacterioides]|uniref:Uncharacterized protein n=1 Tax=Rhodococcoides corynebacterioides TaxID=53972 RepID=A0ABS7P3P3_9NOCA|nr:hypothetical protein [Rhodococcus corynebacterioides]MBY6366920.1 hypothetical protein [Rhodococcus corynebacterioides]MBY6407722.1 hypothetical protein [Rhodococcus corynebacterioides]
MTLPFLDRPSSSPRLSAAQRRTLTRVGYRIGVQAAIDALTRRDIGDRLAHARAAETGRYAAHRIERPAAAYRRARRDVTRESDLDSDRLLRAAIRAGIASEVSAAATAHYNAEGTGEAMHAWTTAIAHADAWNSVLEDAGIDLDELHEELDLDTADDPGVDAFVSDPAVDAEQEAAVMADAQADTVAGVRPGTDVTTAELASPGPVADAAPAQNANHGRSLPAPAFDHATHIDQEVSL